MLGFGATGWAMDGWMSIHCMTRLTQGDIHITKAVEADYGTEVIDMRIPLLSVFLVWLLLSPVAEGREPYGSEVLHSEDVTLDPYGFVDLRYNVSMSANQSKYSFEYFEYLIIVIEGARHRSLALFMIANGTFTPQSYEHRTRMLEDAKIYRRNLE